MPKVVDLDTFGALVSRANKRFKTGLNPVVLEVLDPDEDLIVESASIMDEKVRAIFAAKVLGVQSRMPIHLDVSKEDFDNLPEGG